MAKIFIDIEPCVEPGELDVRLCCSECGNSDPVTVCCEAYVEVDDYSSSGHLGNLGTVHAVHDLDILDYDEPLEIYLFDVDTGLTHLIKVTQDRATAYLEEKRTEERLENKYNLYNLR